MSIPTLLALVMFVQTNLSIGQMCIDGEEVVTAKDLADIRYICIEGELIATTCLFEGGLAKGGVDCPVDEYVTDGPFTYGCVQIDGDIIPSVSSQLIGGVKKLYRRRRYARH